MDHTYTYIRKAKKEERLRNNKDKDRLKFDSDINIKRGESDE